MYPSATRETLATLLLMFYQMSGRDEKWKWCRYWTSLIKTTNNCMVVTMWHRIHMMLDECDFSGSKSKKETEISLLADRAAVEQAIVVHQPVSVQQI
jgi:hypothetical protein